MAGERTAGGRLRVLISSRAVDQAALGFGSLILARALGPAAFAPIGLLFVVNSLAIQVSDFGLGLAIMRTDGEVARGSLRRMRTGAAAVGAAGLVLAVVIGGGAGVAVAAGAVVWALSAEGYVRKAAALRAGHETSVARAEIAGAVVFFAGALAAAGFEWSAAATVLLFPAKHVIELLIVRGWHERFHDEGAPAASAPEWLGQLTTYLVANVDYLALALLLGRDELSIYVVAFRMASAIPTLVANPVTQTAFLELAEASPGAAREETFGRLSRRAFRLGVAGAVVVMVASPVVPWLLGPEWESTGSLMMILALAVPFRLLLGTTVATAVIAGRARAVVAWESGRLVVVGGAAVAGALVGLVPATAAVAAATIVTITVEHHLSAASAGLRADRQPAWAAAVAVPCVVAVAALVA